MRAYTSHWSRPPRALGRADLVEAACMSLEAEFAKLGPVAALQVIAKVMSAPLFWHDQTRPLGRRVLHNGTCCLVNTGDRLIGITACHVYDQYVADRRAVPQLDCQLGRTLFDPTANLIDRNQQLDVATFALDEATVRASGGAAHQPAVAWPAPPPPVGSRVMLGGFPGQLRSDLQRHSTTPSLLSSLGQRTRPRHYQPFLEPEERFSVAREDGAGPGADLGPSGVPVLAVQESPVSLGAWSRFSTYQASFGSSMARPVVHIARDGSLIL